MRRLAQSVLVGAAAALGCGGGGGDERLDRVGNLAREGGAGGEGARREERALERRGGGGELRPLRVGEGLNDGKPFTPFELAILYKKIPPDLRASMIDPYISIKNDEARVTLRIVDSLPDLRRNELLEKIRTELGSKLEIPTEKAQVSGIMVLYNNMLQSLFDSQIQTLGVVMLGGSPACCWCCSGPSCWL